jgi:hypothetical protein
VHHTYDNRLLVVTKNFVVLLLTVLRDFIFFISNI